MNRREIRRNSAGDGWARCTVNDRNGHRLILEEMPPDADSVKLGVLPESRIRITLDIFSAREYDVVLNDRSVSPEEAQELAMWFALLRNMVGSMEDFRTMVEFQDLTQLSFVTYPSLGMAVRMAWLGDAFCADFRFQYDDDEAEPEDWPSLVVPIERFLEGMQPKGEISLESFWRQVANREPQAIADWIEEDSSTDVPPGTLQLPVAQTNVRVMR